MSGCPLPTCDSPIGPREVVVASVFVLWFALSALCQIPHKRLRFLRYNDVFSLVPYWSFFAPQPATSDMHLLVRDCLADGTMTRWQEVHLVEQRRWWHMLWNPKRREKKALFDLAGAICREATHVRVPSHLQLTVPYLTLLQFVSCLPRPPASVGTQFLVMSSHGSDGAARPTVLFLSGLHGLDSGDAAGASGGG